MAVGYGFDGWTGPQKCRPGDKNLSFALGFILWPAFLVEHEIMGRDVFECKETKP